MRRRDFITLIIGVTGWPLAAHGQPPTPVVGYLSSNRAEAVSKLAEAVRDGLAATGFVEGKGLSIEYQWADRHLERLPALARDLIRRRANVIFAVGSTALRAVESVSYTVPIVAVDLNSDPVEGGMAASFAHPGGNVTGVFLDFAEFSTKWLQLLKDTVLQLSRVAILWDPSTVLEPKRSFESAAVSLKISPELLEVHSPADFDEAFHLASRRSVDAVLVLGSPVFLAMAKNVAALAFDHRLPTFYLASDFPKAGGLMSYGPNLPNTFRQAGVMAGTVLRGTRPADLPIQQPTKFDLVVNLKTAKTLGITIPPNLLVLADEVIE
jgi:putative tryptophan/tyrosine transport system substrate-binding protein